MKSATAYKIKCKVFLQGYAVTTDGVNRLNGPVFTAEDNELTQLGKNILNVLEDAGRIIPHRTDWKQLQKENLMLKATKMKTGNELMKNARSIDIELLDSKITLTPYKFCGTSGDNKGYHPLEDKKIICNNLDPESLGRALIEAFERCE